MTSVDVKQGGADWEYTWEPEPGVRQHVRRMLLSMGVDRTYRLEWTSRDPDWATGEPLRQLILASPS